VFKTKVVFSSFITTAGSVNANLPSHLKPLMTIGADQNDDTLLAAALYLKRDMKTVIVVAHWTLADITFRLDAGDIIICIFSHKVLQKVSKGDYPVSNQK